MGSNRILTEHANIPNITGPADGQPPGVIRIDARIPDGIAPGSVPVRVYCGYSPSPAGTTISVQ